jgi:predicted PurR-regulated permease PerM
MLCWSTSFFVTDEAYFFRTILISSILIFSILFSGSRLKISMITAIDEKDELDRKRELDEVSFLIDDYWRFQVINQLCQAVAELKAYILTRRNLLTCID